MKIRKDMTFKWEKFKRDHRSFVSFIILVAAFVISLPAELICNIRPLILVVEGKIYFPVLVTYSEKDFGGILPSEPDYKSADFKRLLSGTVSDKAFNPNSSFHNSNEDQLDLNLEDFEEGEEEQNKINLEETYTDDPALEFDLDDFEEDEEAMSLLPPSLENGSPGTNAVVQLNQLKDYWMIWPPVRYDYKYIPSQSLTGKVVLASPLQSQSRGKIIASSWKDGHYLGTDDRGRDVLARLIYGFRISLIFGFSLAVTGTILGCLIGGTQGFFGGWVDLIGQRLTEIWGSIPRLYLLIILSSFLVPSALLLFFILNITAWMGIAAYIRAEFLKTRNLEYVKAAKGMGVSNFQIMRRHILPNSLTPVITFFPFEVTAGILALVSLDYLNLGVPSPAPSIGELLAQGKNNLQAIWILLPTFSVLTVTLTLLTFVGEGIRNAFDPRKV